MAIISEFMNSIMLETTEQPGLDTDKLGTPEAPSGGAVNMHTIKGQVAVITGAAGGSDKLWLST